MMKSVARLSGGIVLAALLAFAPSAFGRSANLTVAGAVSVSHVVPGFLTFAFDGRGGNSWDNNGNGCSQGKNGNDWGWGWGQGGNNGGKCQSVPEGGTALMYVVLAGLACFGAIVLRSRRQGDAQDQLGEAAHSDR